jgi:endogenous inhibitor of DNA gyrase (YacG/DUF329 family)
VRCPICSTQFEPQPGSKTLPFCSARCQQIDLGRWLGEAYSLPVDTGDDDEDPFDRDADDSDSVENN